MMRVHRSGVVVMLTVGLVVSTGVTVGAETAQKAPPGFQTVKVKKAGFSIAVPDGWSVVDPTRKDADQILDALRESALFLTSELPNAAGLAAQDVVLFAFDDQAVIDITEADPPDPQKLECAECFLVSVRVGVDPGQTEPLTVSDVASAVASRYRAPGAIAVENMELGDTGVAPDADVSKTKIAGVEAVKADFDYFAGIGYSGTEFDRHIVRYTLTGKRGNFTFEFDASAGDLGAFDNFDTMADSIRLLKGRR